MGPLDHVAKIAEYLDGLSIPWVLGGSMASSLMGEARSTNDIDVAITLDQNGVPALIEAIQDEYYAPLEMALHAAATFGSFNLIHLTTSFKIDIFFLGESLLDRLQIERRLSLKPEGLARAIWVTSAPDIILRKLWWYELGGQSSDRQWTDVLNLIRVQQDRLDLERLKTDASASDLGELLTRAFGETSQDPPEVT